MNVQRSLIWELMLCDFVPGHNTAEATKTMCCVKGEGTVNYNQMVEKNLQGHLEPRWSGNIW